MKFKNSKIWKFKIKKKKNDWLTDNTRTKGQLMEINTSITRPCVIVQSIAKIVSTHPIILVHWWLGYIVKGVLYRQDDLQMTSTWTTKLYLVSFVENLALDSHKQNMTRCMIRGRNSTYNAPYSPFSLSTTNITHDGGGLKQVDPHLTLYKRSKSYSPKVSPNHSLFSFLVS